MAQQMVGCLPQTGAAAGAACRPPLIRHARPTPARHLGLQRRSQIARQLSLRVAAADVEVTETVDAPEATPGSDTPPGAEVSSAASNGQRGRGGGRGGGRGAGGRGGRGPRPEPTVKPEDIVVDAEFTGTVRSVQAYGAFVDFGGASHGLVHISQISDNYTDNVSDAVKPGEKVNVRVLSVTDGKVALSMKSKQSVEQVRKARVEGAEGLDPEGGDAGGRARRQGKVATSAGGSRAEGGRGGGRGAGGGGGRGGRPAKPAPKVKVGEMVKAKVQRTTPYGAFLDLQDGTSALLHVSQMANPEGLSDLQPRALLSEGQELEVRVTLVKDGKIDVTQLSKEDEEAEEAAKGGVGTMSQATADAGNMFQFAFARAGVSSTTFETDSERTQREAAEEEQKAASKQKAPQQQPEAAPAAEADPEPEPMPTPDPIEPVDNASNDEPQAAADDSAADTPADSATEAASGLASSAAEAAESASETVTEAAKDPVQAAQSAADTAGQSAESASETVTEAAKDPVQAAQSAADTAGQSAVSASETVTEAAQDPMQAVDSVAGPAGEAAESAIESVTEAAKDPVNAIQSAAAAARGTAESAIETVTEAAKAPVQAVESAAASAREAVANAVPEPIASIAQATAGTVRDEDSGAGASEQQLAAEGEGSDVQPDGVEGSEVEEAPAQEAAPEVDTQPGGGGASERQLAAEGEGGDVQPDGVKGSEVGEAPAQEAAPEVDTQPGGGGASERQLAVEGEGGDVQPDGVKGSEVGEGTAEQAAPDVDMQPGGGGASERQLAAEGEGGDVQSDGVRTSEVDDAPAEQPAPEVDLQPGGSGASEQQLAASGEGGDVQADGVRAEEVAAADGATASQLDAAGEDNVRADGVKESEVQAAAEPAAAMAEPKAAAGVSAKVVQELREKSGAGMMDCKKALTEASGDFDKALEALRVKGLAQAGKKAGRIATEGLIAQYIHAGARLGVLVEVNCETDFVARGEQFKELVSNIAMQIAASPEASYVSIEEVPKEFVDSETSIEMQKDDILAKPENIRGKIVEGRVQKTIARGALLEQPYIRDTAKSVGDVVKEATAALGEKINVRRFERFVLGEGIVKKEADLAAEVEEQTKSFEKKAAEKAAASVDAPAAEVAAEAADAASKPAVQVSAKMVKELREKSGAGMMDCKKAMAETGGDMKAAEDFLRKKGLSSAGKKAGRTAADGAIGAYIHHGSQLGVVVEVNCETDFVARGDTFKELVSDLAMQVAASQSVTVVATEDVDQEMLERERQIELQKEDLQSKPENIREKIVEGRIAKIAKEVALLEQPFIKDNSRTVGDVIKSTIATIGENIQVRRFARFTLGEGLEKKSNDFAAEVAQQTGRA